MINLQLTWLNSIRSWVTLLLTLGYIILVGVIPFKLPKEEIPLWKDIIIVYTPVFLITLNYYFKDKKRNGD